MRSDSTKKAKEGRSRAARPGTAGAQGPVLEDVAHPLLLERSSALMCLHDLEGTLWSVNPAAAEALGYTQDELVGLKLGDLIEPDLRSELDEHLARIRERGVESGLLRVRTRAGEARIWHFSNAVVEKEGEAPFVIGVAQDVTAEHLAQRELRERNIFAGVASDLAAVLAREATMPDLGRAIAASLSQRLGTTVVYLSISVLEESVAVLARPDRLERLTHAEAGPFEVAVAAILAPPHRGLLRTGTDLAALPPEAPAFGDARSVVALPLLVGERRLGHLLLASPRSASESRLQRLRFVVDQLSFGLDRARALAELSENERRFRLLFEEAPIGVYRTTPDGRVVLANVQILRMLGYRSIEELYARDLESQGLDALYERQRFKDQLAKDGVVRGLEARWRRRDGSLMWARENARVVRGPDGEVEYYEGTVEDITERKAAEEALIASEARTRSIIENLLEGMLVVDQRGVVRAANRSAEELFATPRSELIGQPLEQVLAPSNPGPGAPSVAASLTEHAGTIVEWSGRRGERGEFPATLSIVEVSSGRQREFALAVRDLSSERDSERLRRDVLAMVTHDMKTPLTSLMGSLGMLRAGSFGELPEKALDVLGIADRGVRRLSRMVIDLLDAERLRDGKLPLTMAPARLSDLAERGVEAVAEIARQRGVLLETEADELDLVCDADRLIQVITNFLDNAIRHSAAGDVVRLAVRDADGKHVEVTVTDQGGGIPPEERENLFRRYRRLGKTARRSTTGAGLGLAISKELVELHRGSIGVDAGPGGKGSRFWFRVPRE